MEDVIASHTTATTTTTTGTGGDASSCPATCGGYTCDQLCVGVAVLMQVVPRSRCTHASKETVLGAWWLLTFFLLRSHFVAPPVRVGSLC